MNNNNKCNLIFTISCLQFLIDYIFTKSIGVSGSRQPVDIHINEITINKRLELRTYHIIREVSIMVNA